MVHILSFPSLTKGWREVLFPLILANLAVAQKQLWTGR